MTSLDIAHIEFGITLAGAATAETIYMSWAKWVNVFGVWLVYLNLVVVVWVARGFWLPVHNLSRSNLIFYGLVAAGFIAEAVVLLTVLLQSRKDHDLAICKECGQKRARTP